MKKRIITYLKIFAICFLAGYLLLVLAWALPVGRMEAHLADYSTFTIMDHERNYPSLMAGHADTVLDNFTDALMLNMAVTETDENPFKEAAVSYRYIINDGEANAEAIMCYQMGIADGGYLSNYGRYWNGYLAYLKPMLLFLSYDEIRYVAMTVVIGLMAAVIALLAKRNQSKLIVPYVLTMLFLNIPAVCFSLQYVSCFVVAHVAILVPLIFEKKFQDEKLWPFLFFATGIATSYFDLLTYPAVTFGLPMAMLLLYRNGKLLQNMLDLLKSGIAWCVGYLCFWASKWVVGQVLSDEDVIGRSIEELIFRTSATGENDAPIRYASVLGCNLIIQPYYLWAAVIVALAGCVLGIVARRRADWASVATMLVMAVIPFAWYFLTKNHSILHSYMTYRTLAVAVFTVSAVGVSWSKK